MGATRWLWAISVRAFFVAVLRSLFDRLGVTTFMVSLIVGYMTWAYLAPLAGLLAFAAALFGILFFLFFRKSQREPYRTFYEYAEKWEALSKKSSISGAMEAQREARDLGLTSEFMAALESYCNELAVDKFSKFTDIKKGASKSWTVSDKYAVVREIVSNLHAYLQPEHR